MVRTSVCPVHYGKTADRIRMPFGIISRTRHEVHTYAVKSPLVTMARPTFALKVPLPVDPSSNPTTCLIPGLVPRMMPNGIWIRSGVCPQCTGQTDARSDRPTDRSRESLTTEAAALRERRVLIILYEHAKVAQHKGVFSAKIQASCYFYTCSFY